MSSTVCQSHKFQFVEQIKPAPVTGAGFSFPGRHEGEEGPVGIVQGLRAGSDLRSFAKRTTDGRPYSKKFMILYRYYRPDLLSWRYKQFAKLEFCEQNTQDIMCPPRNHDISRFVSWYLSVDSGKIGMKGGVHNEPTKNG